MRGYRLTGEGCRAVRLVQVISLVWLLIDKSAAGIDVSPTSILASKPRTQTRASFFWVKILLMGGTPVRLTCA